MADTSTTATPAKDSTHVIISGPELEGVRRICEDEERTVAFVVRRAVRYYLDRERPKMPAPVAA